MARRNNRSAYLILVVIVVSGFYFAEKYIDNNHTVFPDLTKGDSPLSSIEFSEDFYPKLV